MDARQTYSVPEVAARLGISRGYAYQLAKQGAIAGVPAIHIGARIVFPRGLVDRLLDGEVLASEPSDD